MTKGPSATTILLQCAGEAELWHSPDNEAYATIPVNGHFENWRIDSRQFRNWLIHHYFKETQRAPGKQAISEVLDTLSAQATQAGEQHQPQLRKAYCDDAIYLDLCNEKWQVVCIEGEYWTIIDRPKVKFIRSKLLEPLPCPEHGGSIDDLRQFVNADDEDFLLFVCWLLAALRGRAKNHPLLIIGGEQGSGKSNLTRLGQSLTDPSKARSLSLDGDGLDVPTLAGNLLVLAFDNVSGLNGFKSDLLCRISTGAGIVRRKLYTDDEPTFFEGSRPVIINGIPDLIQRPDLAERAILVQLKTIESKQRRSESEWWSEWERVRPKVLGVLCDALSHAQGIIDDLNLEELPRMADFAKLSVSACDYFGWSAQAVLSAHRSNQSKANDIIFESDSVASAIRSFIEEKHPDHGWYGTATDLMSELNAHVSDDIRRAKNWPDNHIALGRRVKQATKLLRLKGIIVVRRHTGENRQITINRAIHNQTRSV